MTISMSIIRTKPARMAYMPSCMSKPPCSSSSSASGRSMRNSSPRNIPVLRATSRWTWESFSFLTCGMHAPAIDTTTRMNAYRTNVNIESMVHRSYGCY